MSYVGVLQDRGVSQLIGWMMAIEKMDSCVQNQHSVLSGRGGLGGTYLLNCSGFISSL